MALPKGPITIQVSPSTYTLMMKIIELGVMPHATDPDQFQLNPKIRTALDNLYKDLAVGTTTNPQDLNNLETAGINEANTINKNAGSQIVLTC